MNVSFKPESVFAIGSGGSLASITLAEVNVCISFVTAVLSLAFLLWQWHIACKKLSLDDESEER